LDADERAEAYKKLFLRLRDESYQLGMGYANIPWGVGPRVLTWEPSPLSLHPSALHTITLK
jgi:ABC-type transport system substrate-binding protein